jgi:hypothetical protein
MENDCQILQQQNSPNFVEWFKCRTRAFKWTVFCLQSLKIKCWQQILSLFAPIFAPSNISSYAHRTERQQEHALKEDEEAASLFLMRMFLCT